MKRLVLALATLVATAGCGMFTNVPAQIKVASVKGATVTYEKPDATNGWRDIKVDPAEITLVGESGSIGATFEQMVVDYIQINGTTTVAKEKLPPMDLRMSIRVESSVFPADPISAPITHDQIGQATQMGKTTVTLPIVTRHVSAYGGQSNENAGALTAQVRLLGSDDAGFPIDLIAYVPIVFLGPANGVQP